MSLRLKTSAIKNRVSLSENRLTTNVSKTTKDTKHMETIKTIGKILTEMPERDCVHIAVMGAIAEERMSAGDEVKLVFGTKDRVVQASSIYGIKTIGVADPFIGIGPNYTPEVEDEHGFIRHDDNHRWPGEIRKGDIIRVFLFPGTVDGMTHHFHHPDLDAPIAPMSSHEEWLRKFADKWDFDYDEMIEQAIKKPEEGEYGPYGGYVTARGRDLHGPDELGPGEEEAFWRHIAALTGKTFDGEHIKAFTWSCSC